jgi:hypothetical protein
MMRRFTPPGKPLGVFWIYGDGTRFPKGDYTYSDANFSEAAFTLQDALSYVKEGKLIEISDIAHHLQVDDDF